MRLSRKIYARLIDGINRAHFFMDVVDELLWNCTGIALKLLRKCWFSNHWMKSNGSFESVVFVQWKTNQCCSGTALKLHWHSTWIQHIQTTRMNYDSKVWTEFMLSWNRSGTAPEPHWNDPVMALKRHCNRTGIRPEFNTLNWIIMLKHKPSLFSPETALELHWNDTKRALKQPCSSTETAL